MDHAGRARVVYAYHEQTKHHFQRYAVGPHELDWATQADPFRRFEDAELIPLELVEPTPEPDYGRALVEGELAAAPLDRRSISLLLFDSLSLSAWKQAGESRWALRVNPSSGNLHPTECYVLLPSVEGLCAHPGVFHYAPREHAFELRAGIPDELWRNLCGDLPPGSFFAGLTSIHWREAWKYGERAFRYCQHDAGHAIAALSIAASGLGWKAELVEEPGTDELADLLGVFMQYGPEAEHPDGLLVIRTRDLAAPRPPAVPAGTAARFRELSWMGTPNDLSPDHVDWDAIDLAAEASVKPRTELPSRAWRSPAKAPPGDGALGLRPLVRQRRSCQALDGRTGTTADVLFRMLERCLPRAGAVPFNALPWSPRIHLALFVHRVEGLASGLYWLQRDPERLAPLRAALREEFLWDRPEGCPDDLPLFLLRAADLRGLATQVSCHQEIGGAGAFSLGMIADFERSIDELGAWFYPRLFWEAGALGQVLYLEAEAAGLRSTGIGCYFDDPVHGILGLRGRTFQDLYHFTVGRHVEDERLTTLPAYPQRGV